MRVFVAGATGRVAEQLIKQLIERGHTVRAGARKTDKVIQLVGVEPVEMDLHSTPEELASIIQGSDVVYFTAGSRGKDLLQTDAFGAVKLMQAAEMTGVSRFIMLSSIFATEPEKWLDPHLAKITDYNIAKFFSDQWLMNQTRLDYTIVQPGNLVEATSGSGKIAVGVSHSQPNSIPNVAQVLAEVLAFPNTVGKIIQMSDGETPIREALENL
ncbi:SDR family oxidoreductase [Streptococcus himalayensis]|uniref:Oxidoreductase n=1 Tax=Streptococcus himalayensis TaxID=1888195 RepID=A0A917A9Z3_9STRE|nr:SDR family oxidoreductase [Streptococcus himalayensis]GGE37513.1 oxidoreductase [Streptococcus himalayensis]